MKVIFFSLFVLSYFIGTSNYIRAGQVQSCSVVKLNIPPDEKENGPSASISDKLISETLKIMARATLAIVDLDNLKRINIEKIKKQDDAKFKQELARLCAEIENSPLEGAFGIRRDLTKKEAMRIIWHLKKNQLYGFIDSVPDSFIAQRLRAYFTQHKISLTKDNIITNLNTYWRRFTQKSSINTNKE